jgi:hypothetical protein
LCELGCQGAGECACNKVERWLRRWVPGCGRARDRETPPRER